MKILYYNCPAGISGDMHLGALVDLGVDPGALRSELAKLGLQGWQINFTRDKRKGVSGTRCDVQVEESHHHRTFADIREIIEKSSLPAAVKTDAITVFRALAEAEGKVHDKPAEAVHFHEVGALDSIIDITGAAIGWHMLGVEAIAASAVELGSGTVTCAHGRMPVPAPATARLVENFTVTLGGTRKEATTPTGAALLSGKQCRFGEPVKGRILGTGVGIGQRDEPEIANALYVSLMESGEPTPRTTDQVMELATNLDDMTPEQVAFLTETLMEAGALDVWQTPATFKKGRLGSVVSILIQPDEKERFTKILFRHSSTIGLRWRIWDRNILERKTVDKETPLGTIRFKEVLHEGAVLRAKPEFDDLRRLAHEHDLPLSEIEKKITQ